VSSNMKEAIKCVLAYTLYCIATGQIEQAEQGKRVLAALLSMYIANNVLK